VVLVLASVVSAGYYLPVIMSMYMRPARSADAHDGAVLTRPAIGVLVMIIVAVLVLGVVPTEALAVSMQTATALFDRAFAPLGQ
jgi:NADH:ubiquinone oxidoreductase subunit 2 (subunit N)